MDVYNKQIYPFDEKAKQYINLRVELESKTKSKEYLLKVER